MKKTLSLIIAILVFSSIATAQRYTIKGKILGIVEEEKYTVEALTVAPGDKVVLVTDGYTEAYDTTKEKLIGIAKIAATLEMPLNKGITNLDKLEQSIMANNSIDSFNDDRTMLLVEFK